MRTTIVLLIVIIFQWIPAPVRAAGELVVTGIQELTARTEPYVFNGISVTNSGSLTLSAGVVVSLAPGSKISVAGTFISRGTSVKPVQLLAVDTDVPWKGITSSPGSVVSLTNTKLSTFLGPNELDATAVLSRVTLRDGVDNRFVVTGSTPSQNFFPSNVVFENVLRGSTMQQSGFSFEGIFHDIRLTDVSFSDTRVPYRVGVAAITSSAAYNALQLIRVDFGFGCRQDILTDFSKPLPRPVTFQARLGSCSVSAIPVLFVPGIGTSINLKFLSKATSSSTTTDWHFSKTLSSSYIRLLEILSENHIPYEVAYYDWRRPTADVARDYLIPAIARLKKQTGAKAVNIVAHSYGGLVSRSYIQGADYMGDVVTLATLGTPNLGAAKAYGVWEAGLLPSDWKPIAALLRLYAYQKRSEKLTSQDVIHRYIRSVNELLPMYPALSYEKVLQNMNTLLYQNVAGLIRQQTEHLLFQRVRTLSVYGSNRETQEVITTQYPPFRSQKLWPDGEPTKTQPPPTLLGDGTVPQRSAVFATGPRHMVEASHADLPLVAADYLLHELYNLATPTYSVQSQSEHLFVFDCPVSVQLVLPSGEVVPSASPRAGVEVEESDEMLWMISPAMPGTYLAHITALEDTEVRTWVDTSEIYTTQMKKGEVVRVAYENGSIVPPNTSTPPKRVTASLSAAEEVEGPLEFSFSQLPDYLGSSAYTALSAPVFQSVQMRRSSAIIPNTQQVAVPNEVPTERHRTPYLAFGLVGLVVATPYRPKRE